MWQIDGEERPLTAPEWECFKLGLDLLVDSVETGIDVEDDTLSYTGISLFDRQTPSQKLWLLALVGEALSSANMPVPKLTAPVEATLAAILQVFWTELDSELSFDDEPPLLEVRRLLLAAFTDIEELEFPLPSEDEEQKSEWEDLFALFQERFLTDFDFALDGALDLAPEKAKEFSSILGIPKNYFSAVVKDPIGRDLINVRQKIAVVLGRACPDNDGLYVGLLDQYSGLTVGPCSLNVVAIWEKNPWIKVSRESKPQWHCDYVVWYRNFSKPLLTESPDQMQDAEAFFAAQAERRQRALYEIGYF